MIFRILFAQMWKFFSHYGNRALLMLFMIESVGYSDQKALSVYALYAGLFELGGLAGGWIADRLLGVRRALLLGALLIGSGHIVFALQGGFFVGLALIVTGTALFAPTITALLAEVSQDREKHFTIFYVVMNLGALLSTLLCPILAQKFGWHVGFGVAAIGMFFGVITLLGIPLGSSQRPFLGLAAVAVLFLFAFLALQREALLLPLLPFMVILLFAFMVKKHPKVLLPLIALVLFFAVQEQMGSSLLLFTERKVNVSLPTPVLLATNPLVVLIFGTWVAKIKGSIRLILPFLMVGVALGLLGMFTLLQSSISQTGIIATFAVISFAELLIGPYVYSAVSDISSKGTVMGLVPLGFSLAAFLGGGISKQVSQNFGMGFVALALTLLILAFIIRRLCERNRGSDRARQRADRGAIQSDDAQTLCEAVSKTQP